MKCKIKKYFILLIVLLLHNSCAWSDGDYSGKIIPKIILEKSIYTLGESIRFWVEAETKDGSSIEWPEHTLHITRPDGTVKNILLSIGPDGMRESSNIRGGAGLGEEPQPGKYLLVFEILGQKTAPVELYVQDFDISSFVEAAFVINNSKKYSIDEKIPFELRVINKSNDVIKFQALGFIGASLDVFFQDEKGGTASVPYPHDKLIDDQFKNGDYSLHKDIYDWEASEFMPTIRLNPGEVYKRDLWLNDVYQFFLPSLGMYKVTLSTVLTILIGDKGGKYNDFCPIRVPVKAVADFEIVGTQ